MKKDARLTIRIPRELKDKTEGIDRVYGVAEFETVTGREYRNVTASRPERGFSPISIKQTRRPAVAICGAVSCNPTLSAREAAASRLAVVPRLPDEGGLAKTGPPRRSLGEGGLSV